MPAAAASRVKPWVDELSDSGKDLQILTSNTIPKNISRTIRSFFPTPSNNDFLPVRLLKEIFLGFDLGLKIFWRRYDCELCIITSPPFFMACICAFFAKLANLPFIFDVRDRYPRVLTDLGFLMSTGLVCRILESLEGWIYRQAEVISTVTHGLVSELKSNYPRLNFRLVRNGFDELVFTDEFLNFDKRTSFTVVYHGRLGRFYDLELYLEIMSIVQHADSSIHFIMIGELPKEIQLRKPPNLEILPAMRLENLAKVLSSCHLGICLLRDLPAMKNAFPAKAYDYIGAGIPVLAGPRGELSEFVDRFNIGTTFEKISAKEVADTILQLKNDSEVWTKMCANIKKCRLNFGRRKIARKFFSQGLFNH